MEVFIPCFFLALLVFGFFFGRPFISVGFRWQPCLLSFGSLAQERFSQCNLCFFGRFWQPGLARK